MPFMIIIWGSRFMGKVDVVDGLFCVMTKFGHLWYIPLIPTESYVVFEETGEGIRGAPISLSGKSILMGWFRAACILGGIAMGICAAIAFGENQSSSGIGLGVLSAALIGLYIMTKTVRMFSHASYERALQLAASAGLGSEIRELIDAIYGRAPMGGFQQQTGAPDPFQQFGQAPMGQPQQNSFGPDPFAQPQQQQPYGQQPFGQPQSQQPQSQQPQSQQPYDPNQPYGQPNQNWPNS